MSHLTFNTSTLFVATLAVKDDNWLLGEHKLLILRLDENTEELRIGETSFVQKLEEFHEEFAKGKIY